MTIGVPSSSRNCLGVSAPMRVPRPAAGRMAAMRLILGATRLDMNNEGAANFRVYLKPRWQANHAAVQLNKEKAQFELSTILDRRAGRAGSRSTGGRR